MSLSIVNGKTASGFDFAVSENIGNDFRLVRLMNDLENGDAARKLAALSRFPELVLGTEGAEKLYAHLEQKDGTIPTDRLREELTEILRLVGERNKAVKNS